MIENRDKIWRKVQLNVRNEIEWVMDIGKFKVWRRSRIQRMKK